MSPYFCDVRQTMSVEQRSDGGGARRDGIVTQNTQRIKGDKCKDDFHVWLNSTLIII